MASGTMTSKGQITVPAAIRQAFGLKEGTQVEFVGQDDGSIILIPKHGSVRNLKGIVAPLGRTPTVEEMNDAIEDEAVEHAMKGTS